MSRTSGDRLSIENLYCTWPFARSKGYQCRFSLSEHFEESGIEVLERYPKLIIVHLYELEGTALEPGRDQDQT